jgi:glycosyltransferase involved in cell wall biosynthesis
MNGKPCESPLVSVVVNNYNYGRFLREAIDSALNQTYPRTEVVVVDDGSTDDSREIIYSYGDRVIPVLKMNGGQASAFNAGFAISRGDIVIFLDADDYLFPWAVERVAAAWKPGIAKVQYRLEMVDTFGNSIGFYPPAKIPFDKGEVWRVLLETGNYQCPPTSGRSFGRAALDEVLPVPEAEWRISADAYLRILIPFEGQIISIEEALGAYRIHGSNLWAFNRWATQETVSVDRFRTFVTYDLREHELLARKASELGHKVPPNLPLWNYRSVQYRIILLRLEPRNPLVSSDRSVSLVYWGLRAIWRSSDFDLRSGIIHSIWFIWVGLTPLPIAKLAIAWLFVPGSRPRALEWLRKRVRSLGAYSKELGS